jgi:four helix bundle protein
MRSAMRPRVAGVRKAEDFAAWQLAEAFKSEVYALLRASPEAMSDSPFRYQLKDSASGISKHITEGFYRDSPLDFCRFLGYALGSLREAERWIYDGIESGYFKRENCRRAWWFGKRCFTATLRLKHSQERYAERIGRQRRSRRERKKEDDKRQNVPRTRRTRRTDW